MFLICLLLAYVIVRVAEDGLATVRKQTPPRHEYRMAKLKAREANGGKVPDSPFGRYFTGLLDDAWDSAHHKRKLMADHRKEKIERKTKAKIERDRKRWERKDERRVAEDVPPPIGFDAQVPQVANIDGAPAVPATPARPQAAPDAPAHDEREARCEPATPETTEPSNVIPFESTPTPTRMELPMTNPEITGLNSAIEYSDRMSGWCTLTLDQISSIVPTGDQSIASCEQAMANLEAGGVTGQALTDVASAQEQMTGALADLSAALAKVEAAGSNWQSLAAELRSHLGVQEAYAATPDAGSKEFVTAE
jgi:hypothetical protein